MSLFTKISKITSHFWKYNFEIFLGSFKMALLKYFKRVNAKKPTKIGIVLLKPDSPLSSVMPSSSVNPTVMPSSSIESADVAVENVQTRSHQWMTLENISNAGKCVIIRKYFFKPSFYHYFQKFSHSKITMYTILLFCDILLYAEIIGIMIFTTNTEVNT